MRPFVLNISIGWQKESQLFEANHMEWRFVFETGFSLDALALHCFLCRCCLERARSLLRQYAIHSWRFGLRNIIVVRVYIYGLYHGSKSVVLLLGSSDNISHILVGCKVVFRWQRTTYTLSDYTRCSAQKSDVDR